MRIDASSLIAAQSAQRATQPAPRAVQSGALGAPINQRAAQPPSDNPLFEALIFPQAKAEAAPSKPHAPGAQTPPRRPGALLDITV
jgi:hypothetical protein